MSHHAWVCFPCHSAVRRPGDSVDVRCPSCGSPCEHLGYKTPIPPKSKPDAWEAMRQAFYRSRSEARENRVRERVRYMHDLEQDIARLEALPANPGRTLAIKRLAKTLERARR